MPEPIEGRCLSLSKAKSDLNGCVKSRIGFDELSLWRF